MSKTKIKRALLDYFKNFDGEGGAPSIAKFCKRYGISISKIRALSSSEDFCEVLCECSEFRRDYLIDCGLTKRFDASFVKFLLQFESETENTDDSVPVICFEVADEEN
jgi:hypothetical protein